MILLTNDDGYDAPGLACLRYWMEKKITTVGTVAPISNRSGCGSALSIGKEILVEKNGAYQYKIDGTPADAAHIGVQGCLFPVSMVVSGINAGTNFGDEVFSSGTFGAAVQGRFLPCVPIAFSFEAEEGDGFDDFWDAARVATEIVHWFYKASNSADYHNRGKPIVLNVNIPRLPIDQIKGVRVTHLSTHESPGRCYMNSARDDSRVPHDRAMFRIGPRPKFDSLHTDPFSDDWKAVENGYVSITPCSLDLSVTHGNGIERLKLGELSQSIEEMGL